MKRFEPGKFYSVRSPGDHDFTWNFLVTGRTAMTVNVIDPQEGPKTLRISRKDSEYRGAEVAFPFGRYALCPVLCAG